MPTIARSKSTQPELPFTNRKGTRRGGRRKGAGRPKGTGRTVLHRARPRFSRHHPSQVTLRLLPGLPNLRAKSSYNRIKACLRQACERFGFRLVHFSVMSNHLHLVCEASDWLALSRGIRGLEIRI